MKHSTVDVIIPAYNAMPFLKEAVESVLAQDYKNTKIYIIDDESTDNTQSYAKQLRDPRIKYYRKKNGGPSSSRNFGLAHSSSDFVAFLDGDDVWYSHKISSQMKVMESNKKIGLVCGYMRMIDGKSKLIGTAPKHKLRGYIFKDMLDANQITGGSSMVLLRREALVEAGHFRDDIPGVEDWEMWMRICKRHPIDYVPDYLVKIRYITGGGGSVSNNGRGMIHGFKNLRKAINEDFPLSRYENRRLSATCSWKLIRPYQVEQSWSAARRELFRYFYNRPSAIFKINQWQSYGEVILSTPLTRRIYFKFKRIIKL
jgi:glycosyltransferase involved in cell wall biosynthesis